MGRAPCCDKASVKKGPWSPEEDAKLKSYIEKHGTGGNWIALPQKIGLKRCGKSCRLRWLNYLRPNIKHGGFSEEEDNFICSLYLSIGSRWSIIAAQLPGRTDNDIKNYWNTRLKKKLLGKQRKTNQRTTRSVVCVKKESDHNYVANINNNTFLDDHHQFEQPPVALPTTTTTTTYHQEENEEELLVYGGGTGNIHDLSSNGNVTDHDSCSLHPTHVLCSGDQGLIMPCLQPSFHDMSTSTSLINSPTTLLMPTCCPLIINNATSFQYFSSGFDDYDNRPKQTTLEYLDGINMNNMVIHRNSSTTIASPSPEDISSIVSCAPAVFNYHEISQRPETIPQDCTFQESTQTT